VGWLVAAGDGWSLLATEKAIKRERATVLDITERGRRGELGADENATNAALIASGIDYTTWRDMLTLNQDIQLAIIGHLRPSLSGPFMATLLGTVLTLVSAALSFG